MIMIESKKRFINRLKNVVSKVYRGSGEAYSINRLIDRVQAQKYLDGCVCFEGELDAPPLACPVHPGDSVVKG